jgi:hypothetical protein
MAKLERLEALDFPNDLCGALDGTHWGAWLSPSEPATERKEQRRLEYAEWLQDKALGEKGVYIWTQVAGSNLLRFIHVGVSQKGNSTLATRTKCHLRRQLSLCGSTRDRIHRLAFDGTDEFGELGQDLRLRTCEEWVPAANEFIRKLRVLYLIPPAGQSLDAIRKLEGVIAYAASYLLDTAMTDRNGQCGWETTNTLSKTTKWDPDPDKAACVSSWLRKLSGCRILPAIPRRRQ